MIYNPFSGYWHWSENTSLNYAAHAVKSSAWEHPEPAESALKEDTEALQANASSSPHVHEELKKWDITEDSSNMLKSLLFTNSKSFFEWGPEEQKVNKNI